MNLTSYFSLRGLAVIMALWVGLNGAPVQAVSFTVTIDTTALAAQTAPPAPFSLEFQLNDGGGGIMTNTATLSNFTFGIGGAPVGAPTYNCSSAPSLCSGVSGDLSSTLMLSDSGGFFNEFIQGFTPSASDPLSFLLDLTTNVEPVTPDAFSLSIFDSSGAGLLTSFFDIFVQIDITSPLTIATYPSDATQSPSGIVIPAPIIGSVDVPEPAILLLLASGLAGFALKGLATPSRRR